MRKREGEKGLEEKEKKKRERKGNHSVCVEKD